MTSRIVDEYQSPVSSYQLLLQLSIDNEPGKPGQGDDGHWSQRRRHLRR